MVWGCTGGGGVVGVVGVVWWYSGACERKRFNLWYVVCVWGG